MDVLMPLKKGKYLAYLCLRTLTGAREDAVRRRSLRRPYKYDATRYEVRVADVVMPESTTFLVNHLAHSREEPRPPLRRAPERLFLLWTGANAMSENRLRSIDQIKRMNADLEVTIVTPDNIDDFIVNGHPLHDCWRSLSYVHRSDYLRAYLMHHWGGAYADVKMMNKPWRPVIDRLNGDPDLWAAGPAELSEFNATSTGGRLGRDVKRNFGQVLCQAAFAFKPGSSWTEEWLSEVERRLNHYSDLLRDRGEGGPRDRYPEYPLCWNVLLGQVHAPLSLKYRSHLWVDQTMRYVFDSNGYR